MSVVVVTGANEGLDTQVARESVHALLDRLNRVPSSDRSKLAAYALLGTELPTFYYGPVSGCYPPFDELETLAAALKVWNQEAVSSKRVNQCRSVHDMLDDRLRAKYDRAVAVALSASMAAPSDNGESTIVRSGMKEIQRIHEEYFSPHTRRDSRWSLGDTAFVIFAMMTSCKYIERIQLLFGPLTQIFETTMEESFSRLVEEERFYYGLRSIDASTTFAAILYQLLREPRRD